MKNKKWLLGILVIIVAYGLYFYPIQRYLAEKTFNEYIKIQGTTEENIQSKTVFKDYKQNGYIIDVVYKDDPELNYDYKYSVDTIKDMNSYRAIRLNVYTKTNNESVELSGDSENIKYPPIK